jgi:polyphosphate glucokinase
MAREQSAPTIGIDVGGSGIKGAPIDLATGSLAAERVRVPTPSPATPDAVAEVVGQLVAELGVPGPVGVTLPAVVRGGIVRTAANIDKAWIGTDAKALLAGATGRPVTVLNDADAAGVAEVRYGAGLDHPGVVIMLTLGTGIGSAVFVDGRLVPNTELGHLHLHHGDAELYAADSAREREGLGWKEFAGRVQEYLDLVCSLLWPDLIIIGGGVSKKAEKFLPFVECDAEVVAAQMLNEAGMIGAAMAAREA